MTVLEAHGSGKGNRRYHLTPKPYPGIQETPRVYLINPPKRNPARQAPAPQRAWPGSLMAKVGYTPMTEQAGPKDLVR
jgi:hypothetical protein